MSGNSAQLTRGFPAGDSTLLEGCTPNAQNKDKQKDYSEIMMSPLGSSYKIVAIATGDVMERKGAEEALEKSLATRPPENLLIKSRSHVGADSICQPFVCSDTYFGAREVR